MRYIILGAGQAGFMTAKTLRANAPEAEILIFDTETSGLYAKMRLPEYVAGTLPEAKLILAAPAVFERMNVQTRFGISVTAVEPAAHRILADDGNAYSYDKLIFATGAKAFIPPVKGLDQVKCFTLRTLEDARSIVEETQKNAGSVLVVGGGLLGLEAAWALRQRGCSVTVAEFMERLLPRQLREKESEILQKKLAGPQLQFKLGVSLESVRQEGNMIQTQFSDGTTLICALLLFSAGIRSCTDLASAAGIKTDRGIITDNTFQTSEPDIYAAGDCAQIDGKTAGLWIAAKDQALALAEILTGKRKSFLSPVYSPELKIAGIRLEEIRRECSEN